MKIVVKNKLVGKVSLFLLLIVSGIFSYGAFTLISNQIRFIGASYKSEGTVVSFSLSQGKSSKGSITYSPVVKYFDKDGNEKSFNSLLASNPPSHKIGEKVNLLVPSNGNPPQINSFKDLWFGPIIVSFFAVITLLSLFFCIYATIINIKMEKLLKSRGKIISAKVLSVDESTYSNKTTLTYLIKAQWLNLETNKVYVFESEDLSYNPKEFLNETIDVTILPEDPRVYKMDLSKLPIETS